MTHLDAWTCPVIAEHVDPVVPIGVHSINGPVHAIAKTHRTCLVVGVGYVQRIALQDEPIRIKQSCFDDGLSRTVEIGLDNAGFATPVGVVKHAATHSL